MTELKKKATENISIIESKASHSKLLAVITLVLAVFGFLIFIHRLSYYVFEFDPKYSPVDYGKYNILSFFTVQSNFFVYVYLTLVSLAIFGVQRVKKIAFNPTLGAAITTYILLTGIVYCCGIPLGFTPPFKWDTAVHAMSSFIQVYYHMIIPTFMLVLWCFPFTNRRAKHKSVWLIGIYPLVYSIFSIIRGAVSLLHFYPYPFYKPEFIFDLFCKSGNYTAAKAYLLMLPVLLFGVGLFVLVGRLMMFINDKAVNKLQSKQ